MMNDILLYLAKQLLRKHSFFNLNFQNFQFKEVVYTLYLCSSTLAHIKRIGQKKYNLGWRIKTGGDWDFLVVH